MNLKDYHHKIRSIVGLALSLSKANFKTRNEGSYLGILWYLLYPLILFVIIIFIKDVGLLTSKIEYYPIYLLIGLISNNFFTKTISSSIDVIGANACFIKSIKIHYESLFLSKIFESIYSHFFEILLLAGFMIYYKISLTGLIFYPFIFLIFVLFVTGFGFISSTIGVYVNDLKNIWLILSQLIFFITPIFYVLNPSTIQYKVNLFNPLFYFLDITRNIVIYNHLPSLNFILIFVVVSILFFISGLIIFNKFKGKFAEFV